MNKLAMRTIVALILATTLVPCAVAQRENAEAQSQTQIFLQSHPEVVEQLKGLLARQLQQQGSAIDEQAIMQTIARHADEG